VSGSTIFVFDNYTASAVDIAVIASNGQITIARSVPLASLNLTSASEAMRAFASADDCGLLCKIMKTVSLAIKGAACGALIAGGATVPLAVACSARFVADLKSLVTGKEIDESRDALGRITTIADCVASVTGLDYATCVLRLRKALAAQLDDYAKTHQPDITRAREQLKTPAPTTPTGGITKVGVSLSACQPAPPASGLPGFINCLGTVSLTLTRIVQSGYVSAFIAYTPGGGSFYHGDVAVRAGAAPGDIVINIRNEYIPQCLALTSITVDVYDGPQGAGTAPLIASLPLPFTSNCR